MKKPFFRILFAGLMLTTFLTAAGLAQTVDHKAMMVADWTRAKTYTQEYLDAMPEEGYSFKPTPEIRSFAEQMLHFASANFLFASQTAQIPNPYEGKNLETIAEYKTKAGAIKIINESYDFVIKAIQGMDLKKMAEPIKFFNRFETTRGGAFAKAFEHQTHHRGQATIYLRLKGVKPPQERLF